MRKFMIASIACAAMVAQGSVPARANDWITGLAIGAAGVAGALIINEMANGDGNNGNANNNNNSNNRNTQSQRAAPRQPTAAEIAAAEARQREAARVRDVQTWLTDLGFAPGPIDGDPGTKTRDAIREFQASIGEAPTGELTPQQEATLYNFAIGTPVQAQATPPAPITAQVPSQPVRQAPAPANDAALPDPMVLPVAGTPGALQSAGFNNGQPVSAQITPPPPISVLGMRPQMSLSDAEAALAAQGFTACDRMSAALLCEKDGENRDTVLVGFVTNGTATEVHTITRSVTFATPVARTELLDQLKAPYEELITANHRTVASSDECVEIGSPMLAAHFEPFKSWMMSAQSPTPEVGSFASRCVYHYSLDIADAETVPGFSVTMFAGTPIVASLTEGSGVAGASPLASLSF